MALNYQKTIIDGFDYEFVAAEVLDVDYFGENKEKLYLIACKLFGAFGSQTSTDVIYARPLNSNVKTIPLAGEIVFITKGPTAYSSAARTGQEYYYTNPIPIQSSIHHNGIPGLTDFLPNKNTVANKTNRDTAQDGNWNKVQDRLLVNKTIDPVFGERLDVYPIQPYPGDIIFEGRFGQSIRFGSTIDERRNYPAKPTWKEGLGAVGNPITIISNGTNPTKKPFNDFILEEIDKDDSAIWMTSGQVIKFTPASAYIPSIKNRKIDLHTTNEFAGNQVIIASDRIILNAKKQEVTLFAKEGIGLSSEKGIGIDSKDVVEIESARINIGVNAVHPVLLGDVTMNWLADLCDLIYSALGHIVQQTHTSNTGPTGPPINAGAFSSLQGKIKSLRSKIKKLPSDLVFVNEKTGGPKSDAAAESKERSKNNEGYVKPMPSEQDLMTTSDYLPQTEKNKIEPINVVTLTAKIDEVEKQKQKLLEEIENISSLVGTPIQTDNVVTETIENNSDEFTLNSIIPGTQTEKYVNGITFEQLGLFSIETVDIDEEGFLNYGDDINLTNITIPGVGKLNEIPVKFGRVDGNFICSNMELISLKNSPYFVRRFDASSNKLKNLEGGPKTAEHYIVNYSGLTSLTGGPEFVQDEFSVEGNNLKDLVGGPKNGPKIYRVDDNKQLMTLRGISIKDKIEFLYLNGCNLTTIFLKKDTPKLFITKQVYLNEQIHGKILNAEFREWISNNWDGSSDKSLKIFP